MITLPPPDSPIPEEIKKKFDQIKKDLESLKELILKDYRKNLVGIALLPPRNAVKAQEPFEEPKQPEDKDAVNVLMLLSNPLDKKVNKFDFADKASIDVNKIKFIY